MAQVQATLDAGARAKQGYKYTFRDMDASTEDEQIAAHLCLTAYQKYQSHDYASAVKDFGEALKIAPKMPAVYRNWARMEMEAGFYARATEYISKGIDLAPMDVTMWRGWGSIEMKAENYDDAVVKIEHALQIAPDDAELLNLMGEIEKRRGHYSTANDLFHRSLAGAPQDKALDLTITRTAMADNLRRWAEELMPSDTATAMSYLIEAYLIMTEAVLTDLSPRAQTTLREIAFALGQFSEQNGQVADAISYYDR